MSKDKKESLIIALKNCQYLSIGSSCRKLVNKYLGKKRASDFYNLYNYRSQVVHTGEMNSDNSNSLTIYGKANAAYGLALELITSMLETKEEN